MARFEGFIYNLSDTQQQAQGMVDWRGREVDGRFYRVEGEYSAALASVLRRLDESYALLDTAGRFVLGPSTEYSYDVTDSAGLVRRGHLGPVEGGYRPATGYSFVKPDGQPAFSDTLPVFLEAYRFGVEERRQNLGPDLALVRTARGWGVLDRHGRWRVPPRYDQLYQVASNRRPWPSFVTYQEQFQDSYNLIDENRPPEYAYLIARRGNKIGIVRLSDGREIIPPRYDPVEPYKNITEWATYQGFAGYNREGQAYLINTRGQEVAKGRYQGWEFRVRGQRYFFLEQDKSWQDGGRFWTLVDTGGRPLLLPLSRPSFLKGVSPAGLALVAYADSKPGSQPEVAALDTRGRPVLSNLGELSAWHGLVLARHPAADGATRFFDASGQPLPVEQLFQVRLLPPSQRPLDWTAQQPNHWRGRLLSIVAEADKRTLGYLTRGRRLWED